MKYVYIQKNGHDIDEVFTRSAVEDIEKNSGDLMSMISYCIDNLPEEEIFAHLDEDYRTMLIDKAVQEMINEDFTKCTVTGEE